MASPVVCIKCQFYLDYLRDITAVWKSPTPSILHDGDIVMEEIYWILFSRLTCCCCVWWSSLFFYFLEAIWFRSVQSFLVVPLALDLFLGQGQVCMVKVEVCHAILRA